MAQTIQIKRSSANATPTSLSAGELAYSDNSDKLFIGQPSNNTVVTIGGKAFTDKLDGIDAGANNYTLPLATSTVRGGVELFSNTNQTVSANAVTATANKTYGIQLNSDDQMVVNVPWTDTVYSLPLASTSTRGGVKLFNDTDVTESGVNAVSTTAGRYYGVQLTENNKMVVNVPWTGGSLSTTLGIGNTTGGSNIVFGDSSSATDDRLVFGLASDLQIYHDGANSVIEDSGTGNLKLICQDLEVIDQSDNKLFSSNNSAETIFFAAGSDDALKIKNAGVEVIGRDLKVNDIKEYTSGHGVEIESVEIKDGNITLSDDGKVIFGSTSDGLIIDNTTASSGAKRIQEVGSGQLAITGESVFIGHTEDYENDTDDGGLLLGKNSGTSFLNYSVDLSQMLRIQDGQFTIGDVAYVDSNSTTHYSQAVKGVADDDTFEADSNQLLATQQSIKAFVEGKNYLTSETFASSDAGNFTFSGNTISTSGSTVTINDALTVTGDLIVQGTTTTVNSNTVELGDAILLLNSDQAAANAANTDDAGLEVKRGSDSSELNAFIVWDESADRWSVDNGTGTLSPINAENIAIDGGTF